jgi:hypothetical protein
VVIEGSPEEIKAVLDVLESPATQATPAWPAANAPPPSGPPDRKGGPIAWVKEVIEEGLLDQPTPLRDILKALAERGHHLKDSDLTRQMITLVEQKVLRRKKMPDPTTGMQIWFYSKWG